MKNIFLILIVSSIFYSSYTQEHHSNPHIAKRLFELGALKEGDFTFKSGIKSSSYLDVRVAFHVPSLMVEIAKGYANLIRSIEYEHICPVPYGAVPLATTLAILVNKSLIMPRSTPKDHGLCKMIEGIYKPGDRWILVEDVITTGASILETIEKVEKEGLKVAAITVLVDREQGGMQKIKDKGYNIQSVLKVSDFNEK